MIGRRRALVTVVVAVVVLCAASVRTAATFEVAGQLYYIATDGSDTNPGTLSQPWRTIVKANQTLHAGDTVYIRAGTYDEYIDPQHSGAPGNKITYARYRDEAVLLRGRPGTPKLVSLETNSFVVIDGFVLRYGHPLPGDDPQWPWVTMASTAHHNEIRNLTLIREGDPLALYQAGYREWGFLLSGAKYNTIEHNYIRGLNQGIHIRRAAQYNLIQNNTVTGTGKSSIVISSSKGIMQGNVIQNNLLERSLLEDGIQFMEDTDLPQGDDRAADISNFGTIVRNNVIRYHNENAIDLKGAAYVVIEGNTIYGCVGSSNGLLHGWNRDAHGTITRGNDKSTRDVIIRHNVIYDSAPALRAHQGYKIYNNTLVGNNRDYVGPNSNWTSVGHPAYLGVRQKDVGDGRIAVQNNIIVGHNVVEVGMILTEAQARANHLDHNLYYNSAGVFFARIDPVANWEKLTFSQWQRTLRRYSSITGNEQSSIVADPVFASAPERPVGDHAQFDFHPGDGSPAIDGGGALTQTDGNGAGREVTLEDAGYFADGYGVLPGDLVQIGGSRPARITAIDYSHNVITLDQDLSWEDGEEVSLAYHGPAPDVGAYECWEHCVPASPPSIPEKRVDRGLQALYTFEDSSGPVVRDVSGVGKPLELTVQNPSSARWADEFLSIRAPVIISSQGAATKISAACRASNELSLEAWISPANLDVDGPARIVTLSSDSTSRNFTLAQGLPGNDPKDLYDIRLRTTERSENGEPSLSSLGNAVLQEPTHVVYTRDASGSAKIYINNELHVIEQVGGDFSNWDESYPLVVGNEATGGRPWLGKLYLVAVYCRALQASEIWQNYIVGLNGIFEPQSYLPLLSR